MVEVATLELTARTDGLLKAVQALDRVTAAAGRTDAAAGKVAIRTEATSGSFGRLGAAAASNSYKLRGVSQQLSQVGQQTMATGNFVQALAIQLPDIGLAFNTVGAAAGLLAGIALPMLISAFSSGAKEAKTFEDAMSDLKDIQSSLAETTDILSANLPELYDQYGRYALVVRDATLALSELQVAQAQAALAETIYESGDAIDLFAGKVATLWSSGEMYSSTIARLQSDFQITQDQARELSSAANDLRTALTFDDRVAAFQRINAAMKAPGISPSEIRPELQQVLAEGQRAVIAMAELDAKTQDAKQAAQALSGAGPKGGWLSGAISDAATLASNLWNAASAAAAVRSGVSADASKGPSFEEGGRMGSTSAPYIPAAPTLDDLIAADAPSGPSGVGGGGSAGSDGFTQRLESLEQELMTEREVVEAWYQEGQAILADRRAMEILGEEGHKAALEALEREHQERLADIQGEVQNSRLSDAASFFGGMASLAQAGGAKLAKAAQTFGATEALVNSYVAFTAVLRDPSFIGRPLARIGAATTVLAQGLGAVRSIRSGGSGGGSVGSTAIGSQPSEVAAQSDRTIRVNVEGDTMFAEALRGSIRTIADALGEERNIGGFVVA